MRYDDLAEKLEKELRALLPALNCYVLHETDLASLAYFMPYPPNAPPTLAREFAVGRKRVFFPRHLYRGDLERLPQQHRFVIFAPQDINDTILYLITDISLDDIKAINNVAVYAVANNLLHHLLAALRESSADALRC